MAKLRHLTVELLDDDSYLITVDKHLHVPIIERKTCYKCDIMYELHKIIYEDPMAPLK